MKDAVMKFIDKECIIYLISVLVSVIIRQVTDNSLLVETNTDDQLINLDFVVRVREYPKNKNGKNKSIIVDL